MLKEELRKIIAMVQTRDDGCLIRVVVWTLILFFY